MDGFRQRRDLVRQAPEHPGPGRRPARTAHHDRRRGRRAPVGRHGAACALGCRVTKWWRRPNGRFDPSWRAEALRHDALAAERAGVLEDDRSFARVVLIEGDAFMGIARMRLRSSIGVRRRSSPSSSRRSNAQSTAAASWRYPWIRSKTASPLSLQTTASPSIRHDRTGSTVRAATICGKRFEKLLPLALRRFSGSPFSVAIGGITDMPSGRSKCRR